jgi:hypothetical protein
MCACVVVTSVLLQCMSATARPRASRPLLMRRPGRPVPWGTTTPWITCAPQVSCRVWWIMWAGVGELFCRRRVLADVCTQGPWLSLIPNIKMRHAHPPSPIPSPPTLPHPHKPVPCSPLSPVPTQHPPFFPRIPWDCWASADPDGWSPPTSVGLAGIPHHAPQE